MTPLLKVNNLSIGYKTRSRSLFKAVNNVSFTLNQGEILGLVGESGSGKSSIAKVLGRITTPSSGSITFDHIDLLHPSKAELKILQREIQLVFQDVSSSLNPRLNAQAIVEEPLCIHMPHLSQEALNEQVSSLFKLVGLSPHLRHYSPHQLSGGQRQRVAIARALALKPKFIIFDESISALDVSIQSQIVHLLIDLKRKIGLTYLFISHDLSIVRFLSDRVAVMLKGQIVECAPSDIIYESPLHPYTKYLIDSIPMPDPIYESSRKIKKFERFSFQEDTLVETAPNHFVAKSFAEQF